MNDNEIQHIPLIGEMLPTMQVQTTHGPKTLPADYAGKWLVLFSHPADFTPVCTTEFVSFQKNYDKFRAMNTEIEFPIIADTGLVAGRLGFIHPGKNHDTNTVRAVFIIDPEGKVRSILYYPQELGRNMDEILRMVKGLQTSEEHQVALPANWPNNELFGADVIVPPAKDVATIKERLAAAKAGKFTCEDWWLCHKPLNK